MRVIARRVLSLAAGCFFLGMGFALSAFAQTTDISATPSSLTFSNTYVGLASQSKTLTITNLTSGNITIETVSFSCPGFGIASGVAPFELGPLQTITHYSVFFQPTAAQTYNCNFTLNLSDGTYLNVPLTGTGTATTAAASVSTTSLKFPNQTEGTTSAPQTITITNTGTSVLTLNAITLAPTDFTTNAISLPYSINAGSSLPISVYYTPSQVTSESGAINFIYANLPGDGASLSGNGVAATSLVISSEPNLSQATQSAAYEAQLATAGGVGPFTWALSAGSTLPAGLTLSTTGDITGTLASSVSTGNYSFTVQVTDSSNGATASNTFHLVVAANLGDNCSDLSYNDPVAGTPLVALTDLGTGLFEGYEGGLYPNGSNVRPTSHDADGVAFAQGIVPLDSNGNYSPTGKYVLLAVGESTLQNEFNRFLPIALGDPTRNPNLVLVNGAQGGATPNNFTSTTSAYWQMVTNNYLPQNGVTANQVVAAILEDTDGIATGTFPSDITTLQSEYETMMQTMHTLFPNLKLVYFSSRVYAGYSNGVGHPDNPEPYAYEVGYAVKWAIQDQLNGNANLNYNPTLGPVVAPWMSWGPYYWSNGMLGRSDGLTWDCADFASDGTHPSSTYGQLKTATAQLNFLKSDDTAIPWYLAPSYGLTDTGGNNQSGSPGTTLPAALTVLATNLNGGAVQSGVSVTFSDGGAGGSFNPATATTNSSGIATTSYTLPATAKTVTITATSTNYQSATFTETAAAQTLAVNAGNGQTGNPGTTLPTALTVLAMNNGKAASGVSVTFSDGGAGGTFGTPVAITSSNGLASSTYTLPSTAKAISITASSSGYTTATFTETAAVLTITPTAGNNQSGNISTTLPTALTVSATSNGNPVSGVTVTFSDGGAGGTFGTPVVTTSSGGLASTTYTLPATPQTVTISATSPTYTSATFTETATSVVTALSVVSGGRQSGVVGTTLPAPLVIKAKNAQGQAVAGASISFTDGGLGGTFTPNPAITGSNGQASTSYTLPTTVKTITVTSSDGSATVNTTEYSKVGPQVNFTIVSGNGQSANPNTELPKKLVVWLTDQYHNDISGVTVTFTDNGAGGTFSSTTPVTNVYGQASVNYTTGPNAGTDTISASTSLLGPLNFTVTVK